MKLINISNKISQEEVKKWKASIHIEKFTSNNGDCWQTSQRVFGTEFLTESLMKLVGQSSSVLIVLKKPFEKIKSYGEVHSYSLQIDVHSKTCTRDGPSPASLHKYLLILELWYAFSTQGKMLAKPFKSWYQEYQTGNLITHKLSFSMSMPCYPESTSSGLFNAPRRAHCCTTHPVPYSSDARGGDKRTQPPPHLK